MAENILKAHITNYPKSTDPRNNRSLKDAGKFYIEISNNTYSCCV